MANMIALSKVLFRLYQAERPHFRDLEMLVDSFQNKKATALPFTLPSFIKKSFQGRAIAWIEKLQNKKIQKTVRYASQWIPHYQAKLRSAGARPEDVRTASDLRHLPLTYKSEIQKDVSSFLSRHPACAYSTRTHTGGTTGNPLMMFLTKNDVEYFAWLDALGLILSGRFSSEDVVSLHLSLDDAIEAFLFENAARKIGALVFPFGNNAALDQHLASLLAPICVPGKKPGVSVLCTTPSHLLALMNHAKEKRVDLHRMQVKRLLIGGAKVSAPLRKRVADEWGLEIHEVYGTTELIPFVAVQCTRSASLHVNDLVAYLEVLDPRSKEPVADGEIGVAVVTTFYPDREGMPLLRYCTGDLVRVASPNPCVCGLPTTRILEIVGREDGMVVIGGRNYFLEGVGSALAEFFHRIAPPRFGLVTKENEKGQVVVLDIELDSLPRRGDEQTSLIHNLVAFLFQDYWQIEKGLVQVEVHLLAPGTLAKDPPEAVGR